MYKTISRDSVIKALKTEPLRRGDWFYTYSLVGDDLVLKSFEDCPVCAVGAVIRKAARAASTAEGYEAVYSLCTGAGYTVPLLLSTKQYLMALSYFFEAQSSDVTVTPSQRRELIKFVRKNFPKRISVYE